MIWLVFIVTGFANPIEGWNDRKGESKKDKLRDGVILVVVGLLLTGAAYFIHWVYMVYVPLFLGIHRLIWFDYICHWFLKKYSGNHDRINIWAYSGSTADFDKLISRVDWRVKLVIRGVIMTGTIVYLIWQSI